MSPASPSKWYRCIGEPKRYQQTAIWLPHAGGGSAALIRSAKQSPPGVNFFVATLPAREGRFRESMPENLEALVSILIAELPDSAHPPLLVGHSFGGLLAYCMAKSLPTSGLLVMAMSAPDRIVTREPITHLCDREFAERLDQRYGGIPKELRENEEAMRLLLPTVRHDLRLLESYRQVEGETIDAPIIALAGTEDQRVTPADMQGWELRTTNRFQMQTMPGGHFFPIPRFDQIMKLAQTLAPSVSR